MNGLLENLAKTNAQQIEDRDLKTDELLLDSKFDGNNAPDLGKMMSTKEVFGLGTSKSNIPFKPFAESNTSLFGVNPTQSKPIDESKQKKESMQGVPAMTLFELMLTFEMQELTDAGTIVKMETFLDSGTDLVPSKIKSAISDPNNTTTETPNLSTARMIV